MEKVGFGGADGPDGGGSMKLEVRSVKCEVRTGEGLVGVKSCREHVLVWVKCFCLFRLWGFGGEQAHLKGRGTS